MLMLMLLVFFIGCDSEPDYSFSGEGHLPEIIEENSGMAYSRENKRLYTIQDSGHTSQIFVTKNDGTFLQTIDLDVPNNDWEDISLGPCKKWFKDKDCLYVADIGDNVSEKSFVTIYILPELSDGSRVKKLRIKYSTGPTDAESLSVTPDTGIIYIVNKNYDRKKHRLYRVVGDKALFVTHLDIRDPVGAMDISFDGTRAILTTTDSGKFYVMDMATYKLKEISVYRMCCEESVAWINDEEFLYSSEGSTDLIKEKAP